MRKFNSLSSSSAKWRDWLAAMRGGTAVGWVERRPTAVHTGSRVERRETHRLTSQQTQLVGYAPRNAAIC